MLAAVIRTAAYTYQGVDALMLAAVNRTVAYTYPRCWRTHAHSHDPDCNVHLPKVLMHSRTQPWYGLWCTLTQGACTHVRSRDPDYGVHLPKVLTHSCSQLWSRLWRSLTQGVDALMLAAVIRTVAYTYPRCWWTHARSRDPDCGAHLPKVSMHSCARTRDPDCGVHLPKVLKHSCSQPWSGLWRTLTQGVDARMLAAVIRTVAYTYPRCWCTHARSRDPYCGVHLPKVCDALMLAAVIRTVAYTYPKCWCTHARSRDPYCGVHLPKVLMHSCTHPWSGLWRTLTQGVDALMLAAVIWTVAYTYPRCWCTHARTRDPDCGTHRTPSWSWLHGSTQFDTVNSLCTWKGIVPVFFECLYFFLYIISDLFSNNYFLHAGFGSFS
jgi:hypothetical protein